MSPNNTNYNPERHVPLWRGCTQEWQVKTQIVRQRWRCWVLLNYVLYGRRRGRMGFESLTLWPVVFCRFLGAWSTTHERRGILVSLRYTWVTFTNSLFFCDHGAHGGESCAELFMDCHDMRRRPRHRRGVLRKAAQVRAERNCVVVVCGCLFILFHACSMIWMSSMYFNVFSSFFIPDVTNMAQGNEPFPVDFLDELETNAEDEGVGAIEVGRLEQWLEFWGRGASHHRLP